MSTQMRRHLRTASALALAPILLPQALYVHTITPRLPEPSGARSGAVGDNPAAPSLRLLITGDSAAAGVGVDTQTQALSGCLTAALRAHFQLHWRLIAQSGYTTADLMRELNAAPAEPFDVAVISLGVNDILARVGVRRWVQQQQELIQLLRSRFQVRHIVWTAVPPLHYFPALPQPLRWILGQYGHAFNAASRAHLLTEPKPAPSHLPGISWVELPLIDRPGAFASDGFHPGWASYQSWAELAAHQIAHWHAHA